MLIELKNEITFTKKQIETKIPKYKGQQEIIIVLPYVEELLDFDYFCSTWMVGKRLFIEKPTSSEITSDIFSLEGSLQQYIFDMIPLSVGNILKANKKAESMKDKILYKIEIERRNEVRKQVAITKGKKVISNYLEIKQKRNF